jgi:hypothetical protein
MRVRVEEIPLIDQPILSSARPEASLLRLATSVDARNERQ